MTCPQEPSRLQRGPSQKNLSNTCTSPSQQWDQRRERKILVPTRNHRRFLADPLLVVTESWSQTLSRSRYAAARAISAPNGCSPNVFAADLTAPNRLHRTCYVAEMNELKRVTCDHNTVQQQDPFPAKINTFPCGESCSLLSSTAVQDLGPRTT